MSDSAPLVRPESPVQCYPGYKNPVFSFKSLGGMCGPLFLKNQESCGPGSGFGQFWAQESNILAVQADFGNSESPKILKVKKAVEWQFAVCRRVPLAAESAR